MDDELKKVVEVLEVLVNRLDKVCLKLMEVLEKNEKLIESLRSGSEGLAPKALDVLSLLKLPDHLRKTALALDRLVEGTAEDVAKITGRERAVESGYLNQLVRMEYMAKKRVKRKVVFTIKSR